MARKKSVETETESKPATVAERRRALRDAKAPSPGGTSATKVQIDLTKPGARKALAALYPAPESETMIDASPALERAALEFIEQRDAGSIAGKKQDAAGNELCSAIGKAKGIIGEGWVATWDLSKGGIDWADVVAELNIPDHVLERHRKASGRVLTVRETAEEGS